MGRTSALVISFSLLSLAAALKVSIAVATSTNSAEAEAASGISSSSTSLSSSMSRARGSRKAQQSTDEVNDRSESTDASSGGSLPLLSMILLLLLVRCACVASLSAPPTAQRDFRPSGSSRPSNPWQFPTARTFAVIFSIFPPMSGISVTVMSGNLIAAVVKLEGRTAGASLQVARSSSASPRFSNTSSKLFKCPH